MSHPREALLQFSRMLLARGRTDEAILVLEEAFEQEKDNQNRLLITAALAARLQGRARVAVAFFGDGAVEEGVFHESLNFAALRKFALALLRQDKRYPKRSIRSRRKTAERLPDYRASLLGPSPRG